MSLIESNLSATTQDRRNANRGTDRGREALRHSLSSYGAGRSILLARDGTVLAGNKTALAAADLGIEDLLVVETDGTKLVAVRRTDLDPDSDEARLLALADNQVGALDLDFDPAVIDEALKDGLDLSALWTGDELEELLASLEPEGGGIQGDPDAIPEAAPPRCKPGDIWSLGRHRIGCIDSTDREAVLRLLEGDTPGMVFADPPYGISIVKVDQGATDGYVGGGEKYNIPFGGVKNRRGADGAPKPFGSKDVRGSDGASNVIGVGRYAPVIGDETTETAITAYRLCADLWPKAAQVWWGGNYYADQLPPSPCWLVWDKENTGNFADAELAWTNQKTAIRRFRHMWNGMLRDSERERRVHPTQKPVALAAWVFQQYGEHVDLIFDPFLGSGMSILAAHAAGKTLVGCELSPEYVDICVSRYEAATGHSAVRM